MSRRLSTFLDSVAAGEPAKPFAADPDDAELIRTAIELRAARPGESAPREAFVDGLFQRLAAEADAAAAATNATGAAEAAPVPAMTSAVRPLRARRGRTALVAAAAAGVLVAGTAVATEGLSGLAASPAAAARIPAQTELRTGTFQTSDGGVLGQIVAYRGHPSWVFMNVNIPHYDGRVECTLQVADGTTVAFGTFTVHGGVGTFAKQIGGVNVGDLRGATLVDTGGSPVAAATFA